MRRFPILPGWTDLMRVNRRALRILLPIAALAFLPGEASAQNFFEKLFGLDRPARPPAPPQNVPVAPPPSPDGLPPGDAVAAEPKPVVPRQPVVLRSPAEDNVNGQELKLNGLTGALKIERASGGGATATVTLPGTKISQPTESCSVKLNGGAPIALTSSGKPEGVARFEAAAADCPLRFDVLDGSVIATPIGGSKICTFSSADCVTTPGGLWGPVAAGLIPQSGAFDDARGTADRAVRDNFKVMTQRVGRDGIRPVVQEQAAFSSDREELCRTYAREGAHGYCHLRYTEARALSLAVRLGASVTTTASTATGAPRPKRRAPTQPVNGMNPDAAATAGGGGSSAFADQ